MKKARTRNAYTYQVEEDGGIPRYYVIFTDAFGKKVKTPVEEKFITFLDDLKNEENRQEYRMEKHISHFIEDMDDEYISSILFLPLPGVEETVITEEICEAIARLISSLTRKQRRRFILYRVDKLTYKQIALRENCSLLSVYQSVQEATKKIEAAVKNFLEDT